MVRAFFIVFAMLVAADIWPVSQVCGQVLRESDVASVAGTLNKANDPQDDFLFKSNGNQVLVVDLDAEVYIPMGAEHGTDTGGCGDHTTTAAASSGGCEGEEDSGCSDSGPGRFRLELFKDLDPEPICSAGKPARPGWDRDPRFACQLVERGTYKLRVSIVGMGEAEAMAGTPKTHPYVLNISLRNLPNDPLASEESLKVAMARSINRLQVDEDDPQ